MSVWVATSTAGMRVCRARAAALRRVPAAYGISDVPRRGLRPPQWVRRRAMRSARADHVRTYAVRGSAFVPAPAAVGSAGADCRYKMSNTTPYRLYDSILISHELTNGGHYGCKGTSSWFVMRYRAIAGAIGP